MHVDVCIVPAKSVNLDRDFGVVVDELGMLRLIRSAPDGERADSAIALS